MENEEFVTNEANEIQEPSQENQSETSSQKKHTFFVEGSLYTFLSVFGIVFLACLFVFQILLTPVGVIGESMQPTINASVESSLDDEHCDVVYIKKNEAYSNNDIVIVENTNYKYIPYKQHTDINGNVVSKQDVNFFIKRVIACPNQTLTFYLTDIQTSGFVLTYYYDISVCDKNGNAIELDKSYLLEEMFFTSTNYHSQNDDFPYFKTLFSNLVNSSLPISERKVEITLNENEYFVMGDNRNKSTDSRYFGAVHYDDISGESVIHVPYGKTIWQAVWLKLKTLF